MTSQLVHSFKIDTKLKITNFNKRHPVFLAKFNTPSSVFRSQNP